MAQKQTKTPKVALSGHMYQRSGRWWWRVRLPGEDSTRARPLCKKGDSRATRNRRMAEQIALCLWQEALVHETENRFKAMVRYQDREKSRAYAYLIDLLCEGLLLNSRLDSSLKASTMVQEPLPDETEEGTMDRVPCEPVDVVASPEGVGHVSDISDLLSLLSEGQKSQSRDQSGCDCCGIRDFYEEYLHRIDSGQRLCPRCFKALQEKVCRMQRSLCNT